MPLCLGHGGLHLFRNLRRVRRARTQHNLESWGHLLNRTHQVDDAFLPRDTPHEEDIRHIRIDPMMPQHIGLIHLHIFIQVDSVVNHMQLRRVHLEQALHIHLGFLRNRDDGVRHLDRRAL